MNLLKQKPTAKGIRVFFLYSLFFFIPFSIAGDDFATIGLYIVSFVLLIRKQIHWEKTPITLGLGIYLIGAVISTLLSHAPLTGFVYFRSFWRLGLPFLVFFTLKDQPVERFVRVLGGVAVIIGLYAIVQFYTGLDVLRSEHLQNSYKQHYGVWHAVGVFSHHLTFGGVFLMLFAVFSAMVITRELNPRVRIFYAFVAVICLISLFFSFGRSIWIGAIVAVVVSLFVLIPQKIKIISIIVLICLAVITWFSLHYLEKTKFAEKGIGHRILSATSIAANKDRLLMWQAGIEIIKDNPIFGLGPKMAELMEPYYKKIAKENNHNFQHAPSVGVHNIYLQNWIDFGILGFLGFLLMFLTVILAIGTKVDRITIRKSTDHAILLGIMAGLCGNLASGFFENNFRDGEVQVLILTLFGIAMTLLKKKPSLA